MPYLIERDGESYGPFNSVAAAELFVTTDLPQGCQYVLINVQTDFRYRRLTCRYPAVDENSLCPHCAETT